jgi:hypothetical protein
VGFFNLRKMDKQTRKEAIALELEALKKWQKASQDLKVALEYAIGEEVDEQIDPTTGLYHVDDDFLQVTESCYEVYLKCSLARKRYMEIVEANNAN